jgi:hypothetical protein
MIFFVRHLNNEKAGFDDITYYFATTDINEKILVGETWSPKKVRKGSSMDKLTKIFDDLYFLSVKNKISQLEIGKRIKSLIIEMEKPE